MALGSANLVKVGLVRETTLGTVPATPKWEPMRYTGETLTGAPRTVLSDEIVTGRMVADLTQVGREVGGNIDFEWSYHRFGYGGLDLALEGALCAAWTKTPEKDNDGTADSAITDVAVTTFIITTTAVSPAWAIGMLIRATGFTDAANNRFFRASAGSATSITPTTGGATEAAPPGTARVKCIGVQGASGDLLAVTAGGNGLTSTALNWTTFGLAVGQWVRIGTEAGGDAFSFVGTAANNGYARISVIAATKLSFDIVPTGWAADTGAGKTIRVFFGDYLRNGTTVLGHSIEKQHTDLAPVYQVLKGMVVNTLTMALASQAIVRGTVGFLGMGIAVSATRTTGSTDGTAETADVLNAAGNVGRVAENGTALSGVYMLENTFNLTNNARQQPAVGGLGASDPYSFVGIALGRMVVSGTARFYFANETLLNKALNSTASSLDWAVKDAAGHTFLVDVPKVKFGTASAPAAGLDQDIVLEMNWQALKYTPPTGADYQVHVQRLELAGTAA